MAWCFVQLVKANAANRYQPFCCFHRDLFMLRRLILRALGVFVVHGGRQSAAAVCLLDLISLPQCYVSRMGTVGQQRVLCPTQRS
jgi:hypothetical protein